MSVREGLFFICSTILPLQLFKTTCQWRSVWISGPILYTTVLFFFFTLINLQTVSINHRTFTPTSMYTVAHYLFYSSNKYTQIYTHSHTHRNMGMKRWCTWTRAEYSSQNIVDEDNWVITVGLFLQILPFSFSL